LFQFTAGEFPYDAENLFPKTQMLSKSRSVGTLKLGRSFGGVIRWSKKLLNIFPNVRELHLNYPVDNFPPVGRGLWKYMQTLHKLNIIISLNYGSNAFPAIDSTFTGIPVVSCEHVLRQLQNAKKSNEAGFCEPDRIQNSLLNMKCNY
jgi:hypothetical protein